MKLLKTTTILPILLLAACSHLSQSPDLQWQKPVAREMRSLAPNANALRASLIAGEEFFFPTEVLQYYEAHHFRPGWLPSSNSPGSSPQLLEKIEKASEQGLNPAHYHLAALHSLATQAEHADSFQESVRVGAQRELLLSDAFVALAHDLAQGAIEPRSVDPNWAIARNPIDLPKTLSLALSQNNVGGTLDKLPPQTDEYRTLKAALEKFRQAALVEKKRTVVLNGNATAAARADEVRIALERLRWLPRHLGERYLFVDIAGFRLSVVEKNQVVFSMPAIVGKVDEPTPIFNDRITYLVLNPTWILPRSIVLEELLPKLQADASYLQKKELKIFDRAGKGGQEIDPKTIDWKTVDATNWKYYLRQASSPKNPLGKVKFMFPNNFAVYIHGSAGRGGFARAVRSESHGCVRVERPMDLAAYLLKDNSVPWDLDRVNEAVASGEEQAVKLKAPMPVYLFYSTTRIDEAGRVVFRPDLYHWNYLAQLALDRNQQPASRIAR